MAQDYSNYYKEYYQKNKETIKEYRKKYLTPEKQKEYYQKRKELGKIKRPSIEYRMWQQAQYRARDQGLPFTIEVSDIKVPDVCPILGIPLLSTEKGGTHLTAPSLDRLSPEKGYTKENTRVISNRANRLKSDHTVETLEATLRYLRENLT